jgi:hypothetical protein
MGTRGRLPQAFQGVNAPKKKGAAPKSDAPIPLDRMPYQPTLNVTLTVRGAPIWTFGAKP